MRIGLVWFREDLRIKDNAALAAACNENDSVLAVYVIDRSMWKAHDIAACRVEFILRNLSSLYDDLTKSKIRFLIFEIEHTKDILFFFNELIDNYHIDRLYYNEQYEADEWLRDKQLTQKLSIPTKHFVDQTILAPDALMTTAKTPYTIFTPYKNAFIKTVSNTAHFLPIKTSCRSSELLTKMGLPEQLKSKKIILHHTPPESINGYHSNIPHKYWPAGEKAAQQRLKKFISEKIDRYQLERDFPDKKSTSKLSAYLAAGVLSPRQCFTAALEANGNAWQGAHSGISTWISELIWREFYKQILANFPRVSKNQAFKIETDHWPWRKSQKIFNAWTEGKTGYPLIDAAMRQLHSTGWMHNRLRMVVAMFLTKDCFIDWRMGEKYFMQHLIDGDLAANNGGWQWAASTGCDAAPYFRVFNPVRQSERFDAEGSFIKTYCPELKNVPAKILHDPFTLPDNLEYPKPIVDYRETRSKLKEIMALQTK